MKLCLVIPSMLRGGAERVMSILCNEFDNAGNEVSLILTEDSQNILYPLNKNVTIIEAVGSSKKKWKRLLETNRKVKNAIKENQPDVVISFITRTNIMSIIACKTIHIPVIVSERNNPFGVPANPIFRVVRDISYRHANGLVFQTQYAQSYFSDRIKMKSVVIMNPVSDQVTQYSNPDKENVIVSVGRLEEQKNMQLIIRAFSRIANTIPDYSLEIYGEGSLRKGLTNLINELNLSDRVFLKGQSDNVIREVSKAKAFVLASNFEGMPNALLEAMCLGIACVATDSPAYGNRDLIKDGENGFLVPLNDEEKLAEKMLEIIQNDDINKRFSINARSVYKKANKDTIFSEWDRFIKAIKQ